MFKALLKKQFAELNASYFQNRKTGKMRSRKSMIGMIVLYAFLFLMIACSFFAVASMIATALVPADFGWLFFVIVGVLSILLGVFGGVFSTYTGLYLAKDNEMLLAMPIQPRKILAARLIGVYAMGLLYEALVFIPSCVAYYLAGGATVASVITSVPMIPILGFLVLTLTCLFGWLVALLSSRLKRKSVITVILSLVFIGVYYYFCLNYYSAIQNLVEHASEVGVKIKSGAYPLYLMGRAADGHIPSFLIFTLAVFLLAALTYYILSKTFLRLATRHASVAKAVYKEKPVKQKNHRSTLLFKEWKRFSSSANYMLNCGLGAIFMPAAGIAALIFRGRIQTLLDAFDPPHGILAVIAAAAVCLLSSMCDISAPSVSLEGRNLWILQSMPVNPAEVLDAKLRLHKWVALPPTVFLSVALAIVLKADFESALLMTLFPVIFVMFSAAGGLAVNLLMPNVTWTNEITPIKQGASVTIALFGAWLVAILFGVGGYFACEVIEGYQYLLIAIVVFSFLTRLIQNWIRTKGAEIFASL